MKRTITLGAGCFWGTQAYFDLQKGVLKTSVGYANGSLDDVTYEKVCNEETGFVEACQIDFDDQIISLETILDKYWSVIDSTLVNRQANDIGAQYRTGIYYNSSDQDWILEIIEKSYQKESEKYSKKLATEAKPLIKYILAEEYHQKYLEKNPNAYCHIDLSK